MVFFFYSNLLCAAVDFSTVPPMTSESNIVNKSRARTSMYTLIAAFRIYGKRHSENFSPLLLSLPKNYWGFTATIILSL